jgi:hypothetical protein
MGGPISIARFSPAAVAGPLTSSRPIFQGTSTATFELRLTSVCSRGAPRPGPNPRATRQSYLSLLSSVRSHGPDYERPTGRRVVYWTSHFMLQKTSAPVALALQVAASGPATIYRTIGLCRPVRPLPGWRSGAGTRDDMQESVTPQAKARSLVHSIAAD